MDIITMYNMNGVTHSRKPTWIYYLAFKHLSAHCFGLKAHTLTFLVSHCVIESRKQASVFSTQKRAHCMLPAKHQIADGQHR